MTNEEKAKKYNQMMFEYTRIQNQISSIKGESFEMNGKQIQEIKILEERLKTIMRQASLL
jgi:archaellum component FlaC